MGGFIEDALRIATHPIPVPIPAPIPLAIPSPVPPLVAVPPGVPLPPALDSLNNMPGTLVTAAAERTAETVSRIGDAIQNPTLENVLRSIPGDPLGITHTPAELWEDISRIASSSSPGDLLDAAAQITVKEHLKTAGLMPSLYAIVTTHWNNMRRQATNERKWKGLSQRFIDTYQAHFTVNLSEIRYAENINTRQTDTAITFPSEIFFPRSIAPDNPESNDLRWMLHELTHAEQYRRLGGLHPYIDEYTSDIIVKIISKQTFDPHDGLAYEVEANEKAGRLRGLLEIDVRPSSPRM